MQRWRIVFPFYFLSGIAGAHAQTVFTGTVYESDSNVRLSNVFVKNLTNKTIVLSDASGKFTIRAATSQLLVFSSPGYVSDTLFLTDLKPRRIYLPTKGILLKDVRVTASGAFNPKEDYAQVYRRAKITGLSPSQIFGKDARRARRFKRFLDRDEQQRKIDAIFNKKLVSDYLPLKGRELEDFMFLYRPTYQAVKNISRDALALYLNDCYKKFMVLPAEKRVISALIKK
ncbi:MAG: hypothetical protein ACOH2A_15580 [Sphingobacteriaceae bacterium]